MVTRGWLTFGNDPPTRERLPGSPAPVEPFLRFLQVCRHRAPTLHSSWRRICPTPLQSVPAGALFAFFAGPAAPRAYIVQLVARRVAHPDSALERPGGQRERESGSRTHPERL